MSKILITGATGRLGQLICNRLRNCRLLVRDSGPARSLFGRRHEIVEADLLGNLSKQMKGVSKIVHIAGQIKGDSKSLWSSNVEITKNLLRFAPRNLSGFILASSTSLHWEPQYQPIDELQPPTPVSAYGRSKLAAEEALIGSGLPYIILRIGAIYGPGFIEERAKLIRMVEKRRLWIGGIENNRVGAVYSLDVARAFLAALRIKSKNQTILVTDDYAPTVEECLQAVLKSRNVRPPIRIPRFLADLVISVQKAFGLQPMQALQLLLGSRTFDNRKAHRLLGYRSTTNLAEWIANTPL